MKYFLLDPLGDLKNEDYCFTDNDPGPVIDSYDLWTGLRVADEYPDGIGDVALKLGEDHPGLELPSYLGNTHSLLIVNQPAAAIIRSHDVGEIEVIPFKLINHKGRVHSRDYVFLNPIGHLDCLDMEKTACMRHKDGSIMRITKFVLASSKLQKASALFRPQEDRTRYIFGDVLVSALRDAKCTNFLFNELEQG